MAPAASFEDEISKLAQRLAANPTSRIFAPLAEAYRRAGRLSEAIDVCRQGLRHHPDYLSGLVVLARTYHDAGDLEAAGSMFERILQADPRNVGATRALGEIAHARGDVSDAWAHYRRALDLEPDNAELRQRIESLRDTHARAEAAAAGFGPAASEAGFATAEPVPAATRFEEVFGRSAPPGTRGESPAEPAAEEIATVTLADVYAEQGLLERALEIYRRLLDADPENKRLREKVRRVEGALTEMGVPVDAGTASPAVGFEPREIRITGEQAITAGSVAAFTVPPSETERSAGFELPEDVETRRASTPAPVPWAFLLEDELDRDPDEVFAMRGGTARSEVLSATSASEPGSPPGAATVPGTPETASLGEDDLKKFQEWLKSLR